MLSKQIFAVIFVLILALVACGGTPQPQPTPQIIPVVVTVEVPSVDPSQTTPVFIPVLVTVEVPITVTVPAPTITPSGIDTPPSEVRETNDLEEDTLLWDVYLEGSPTPNIDSADTPSLEGRSLQCSITGGSPYSNVHCYRNLPPEPDANTFMLGLSFQFTPTTTCNNQEADSIVQGIEFTMNKWQDSERYEFALQWQNVGDDAPQWRYWDASQPDDERWRPINSEVAYCLEGEKWHTLNLEGQVVEGQVYYKNFTIDNITYDLDITVPPASTPGEQERLAVAVQVDGNSAASPYDLFIDQVSFLREAIIDCRSVKTAKIVEPLDDEIVKKDTRIVWTPACPMVLQYHQNDNPTPLVDEIADSGEFDFSMVSSGRTEIKLWVPGTEEPADSIYVIVD